MNPITEHYHFIEWILFPDRPMVLIIHVGAYHILLWHISSKLTLLFDMAIYPYQKKSRNRVERLIYEISLLCNRSWRGVKAVRQNNIHKFTLHSTVLLFLFVYLGSFFTSFSIVYITGLCIVTFPYIVMNGIYRKVYSFSSLLFYEAYFLIADLNYTERVESSDDSKSEEEERRVSLDQLSSLKSNSLLESNRFSSDDSELSSMEENNEDSIQSDGD